MIEALLSYEVAASWNVGVGGRYWAWNVPNGTIAFQITIPMDPGHPPRSTSPLRGGALRRLSPIGLSLGRYDGGRLGRLSVARPGRRASWQAR